MHILIADDDPGTRLVVTAAVEKLGHECTVAEDGAQAWKRFGEVAPDVVITDWEMPEMDGAELTRRIRSQSDVPYPYVIVLTARADQDQALITMEAGADDIVFKPLRRDELERMLVGAARVTALHRRLHRDARQDALTGPGNRHRLAEDLAAMQARAERYGDRAAPDTSRATRCCVGVAGPAGGAHDTDELVGRADAALYAAEAAARNRVEVAREPAEPSPIRVMVADDELVTMLLSTIARHEPTLELIGTMRRPQVVLLDLDMPRGGGTAAATEIRTKVPDARIVALSANDSQVAMLEMARAGAVGYIVEGAAPATIVDTIRGSAKF